jgi:hypothetical protein
VECSVKRDQLNWLLKNNGHLRFEFHLSGKIQKTFSRQATGKTQKNDQTQQHPTIPISQMNNCKKFPSAKKIALFTTAVAKAREQDEEEI